MHLVGLPFDTVEFFTALATRHLGMEMVRCSAATTFGKLLIPQPDDVLAWLFCHKSFPPKRFNSYRFF
jgi:hypothetical protein